MKEKFDQAQIILIEIDDARQTFRKNYQGFEHWTIITDDVGVDAIAEMFKRYYRTCPDDFVTLIAPGFIAVSARKSRMTVHQLQTCLRRNGAQFAKQNGQGTAMQDVIGAGKGFQGTMRCLNFAFDLLSDPAVSVTAA